MQNTYPTYLKALNALGQLFILKYFWSQPLFFSPEVQDYLWEGRREVNTVHYTLRCNGVRQQQVLDETPGGRGRPCARSSHCGCSAVLKGCACWLPDAEQGYSLQAPSSPSGPQPHSQPPGKAGQEQSRSPLCPTAAVRVHSGAGDTLPGCVQPWRFLCPLQFTELTFPTCLLVQLRLKNSLLNGRVCLLALRMFI